MLDLTKYEAEAYELGAEHARNAASWVVDGNTKRELAASKLPSLPSTPSR